MVATEKAASLRRFIDFEEERPRTPTGNLVKRLLIDHYCAATTVQRQVRYP